MPKKATKTANVKTELKNTNILNIEVETYEDCGYCKSGKDKMELTIPWEIWTAWLYLMHQMDDKEWGAVFWVENGVVTKWRLPKQEVSGAECEFKEDLGGNGVVHSHHSMGSFHSHQDDRHARNMFDYSIVLSHSGYVCTRRGKLPCAGFGYKDVEVFISGVPEEADTERIEVKQYKIYNCNWKDSDNDDRSTDHMTDKELDDWYEKKYGHKRLKDDNETLVGKVLGDKEQKEPVAIKCDTCLSYNCENCDYYAEAYGLYNG